MLRINHPIAVNITNKCGLVLRTKTKVNLGTRCSLKMSKNMNKRATENYILFKKFLAVSSVSSDSIVKGIIDDIINTAVKTAEVDEQKTKYLQHLHPVFIE
jgi:hypothetical protein